MRVASCSRSCRRRGVDGAVVALLVLGLLGCAGRPGPEALTPIAATPGVKSVQVYVATTRERENPSENVFTATRANTLNFARFAISVPPGHLPGKVEMPTSPPDPQTGFAVLDQAVMSEADFRKAIAPRGAAARKKHKVFVFVHGFNNNFQESLFRLTQLQADAQTDGIPVLFSWPSQGQVTAYESDKESASYSRDHLISLLTMLASSPEVGEVLVVGHSMGGKLLMDGLHQLRIQGKNQVIARLGRVVLAAPDMSAQEFRTQVQAIGPLKPPLLVLVSKDDGALRMSSLLGGGEPRVGAIDVNNPIVQEAAQKAKVQVIDISQLDSQDGLKHDQFVSVAVLYSRIQARGGPYRTAAGTFVFNGDNATLQPAGRRAGALAQ